MTSAASLPEFIIELESVDKRFGGAHALQDITLSFESGGVHALVGENGAGKSTLGKIVSGVHRRDSGVLRVGGREVDYHSPRDALDDGVAIIAQELALVPDCSVMENVYLGEESRRGIVLNDRRLRRRYDALVERTGFQLTGETRVGDLRIADRQKVEILRALARDARVIVMDEPTAALSRPEAELLLRDIRDLRDAGTTIIYVSHFLEETFSIADTVTVLRDGRVIGTVDPAEVPIPDVVTMMLGRSQIIAEPQRRDARQLPVVLELDRLKRAGVFEDVSFELRAGEIVALAGLVGAGRSEIARAIFGADRVDDGRILVDGTPTRFRSPRDAIRHRIAMLPESRKDQGLVMGASVADNMTLGVMDRFSRFGVARRRAEREAAKSMAERVAIRGGALSDAVSLLSGGNQQKALFGKWLLAEPRVLIVDEPTRGVDIGAKQTIYELLRELAARGMAVLVVSSDLDEVIALADRVLVVRTGRVVAEFHGDDIEEERIMRAAFGGHRASDTTSNEGTPS